MVTLFICSLVTLLRPLDSWIAQICVLSFRLYSS